MKLSRRDFIHAGYAVAAASLTRIDKAEAFWHGNDGSARIARSQLGLQFDHLFANAVKEIGHSSNNSLSNNYPYQLDQDGYPKSTSGVALANNIPNNNGFVITLPPEWTGNWIVFWSGKTLGTSGLGSFLIAGLGHAGSFNIVTDTGPFVSGSASFNLSLNGTMNGTTDKVVFNWNGGTPSGSIACYLPAGFVYDGTMGNLVICRDNGTDEALCRANPNAWLPEFITELKAMNPKTLRMMDLLQTNGANRTQSKYRPPVTSLGFELDWWNANTLVSGDITGTTTGGVDVLTAGAYPDMPGTWTDKETFQGRVTFTNTGVPMTINVGGRGAKTVTDVLFAAPGASTTLVAGTLVTFTYDATLNQCQIWQGGFTSSIPYELCVDLANTVGCDLWYNFPHLTDDASVTATITYIAANLNAAHRCISEYTNECWNGIFGFWQTTYAGQMGYKMGFPALNSGGGADIRMPTYNFYGNRVKQIAALVKAARGGNTKMLMAMASQGGNLPLSFTDQFRFQTNMVGTRVQITAITNANPGQVTTATPHGFSNNDIIMIGGTNGTSTVTSPFPPVSGMIGSNVFPVDNGPINGQYFAVANATATTFTLLHIVQGGTNFFTATPGANFDTTSLGTYTTPFTYCWKCPVAPNRPGDAIDVVAYATYSAGDIYTNAQQVFTSGGIATLLTNASLYVGGGGGVATALNWLDNDYQNGTGNAESLLSLATNYYPAWNTLTARYTGTSLECYEGGCEMATPTGATINSLGGSGGDVATSLTGDTFTLASHGFSANQPLTLSNCPPELNPCGNAGPIYYVSASGLTTNTFKVSATPGGATITTSASGLATNVSKGSGNAAALLFGYKNDARFQTATLNQFNQFTSASTGAASSAPSWFQAYGGSQWSAYPGDPFSTPFQSWNAMTQFNT